MKYLRMALLIFMLASNSACLALRASELQLREVGCDEGDLTLGFDFGLPQGTYRFLPKTARPPHLIFVGSHSIIPSTACFFIKPISYRILKENAQLEWTVIARHGETFSGCMGPLVLFSGNIGEEIDNTFVAALCIDGSELFEDLPDEFVGALARGEEIKIKIEVPAYQFIHESKSYKIASLMSAPLIITERKNRKDLNQ